MYKLFQNFYLSCLQLKLQFATTQNATMELEETSIQKTVITHAGNVYVPRDLDLWPFDPKINQFSRLMVEHLYVQFGDPSCIGLYRATLC